jgi:hypothetical protein
MLLNCWPTRLLEPDSGSLFVTDLTAEQNSRLRDAIEGREEGFSLPGEFYQSERAHRGVNSSRYVPGPYSSHKEYNVDRFVRWYLHRLSVE